jgi:hypothetical protein
MNSGSGREKPERMPRESSRCATLRKEMLQGEVFIRRLRLNVFQRSSGRFSVSPARIIYIVGSSLYSYRCRIGPVDSSLLSQELLPIESKCYDLFSYRLRALTGRREENMGSRIYGRT